MTMFTLTIIMLQRGLLCLQFALCFSCLCHLMAGLDKLFDFSEPSFSHVYNGNNNTRLCNIAVRIQRNNVCETLSITYHTEGAQK